MGVPQPPVNCCLPLLWFSRVLPLNEMPPGVWHTQDITHCVPVPHSLQHTGDILSSEAGVWGEQRRKKLVNKTTADFRLG